MSDQEGYLHEYLIPSFIGIAFGMLVMSAAVGGGSAAGIGGAVAGAIFGGLFGFIPAGMIAVYLISKFRQMSTTKMAGMSIGFFQAFVYTIITLITALVGVIGAAAAKGNVAAPFISWIIGVVFAFIFMSLGGYLESMLEERPFAMPGFFNLEKVQRAPPPPPMPGATSTAAQACPTCGRPMRFVEQYNRWYCDYDKKYA